MRIKDKSKILCEWMLYDSRTICPKEHSNKCDGSSNKTILEDKCWIKRELNILPILWKKD